MQQQPYETIIEKNGLVFVKLNPNKFNLTFDVNNTNIMLSTIINFDLIHLMEQLNPNIFESITLQLCEDGKNGKMDILLRDIFCDLGLSQYYLALNIHKYDNETNKIIFRFVTSTNTNANLMYPDKVELLPIQCINLQFHIVNCHSIKINCDIDLIEHHNIPSFSEKMIGNII
jgi:hypothetical protein